MIDRAGQTWEFVYALNHNGKKVHENIIYHVLRSSFCVDGEGTPMMRHVFFNMFDGDLSSWWERDDGLFERCTDRRRLA